MATPVWATQACVVTSDLDIDPVTNAMTPGSFRQMLWFAMAGVCQNKVITIKVPKITMNAPLGTGIFSGLKGFEITPDASIPQVEITVKYDTVGMAAGCSAPSPFDSCFAYLPTSDVSIHNVKVVVDSSGPNSPKKGLCVDRDDDAAGVGPTNNRITLDNNVFDGFINGGIFVSYDSYGVTINQTTYHGSGAGIVVEQDPTNPGLTETPAAPFMGGSDQAVFAVVDSKGSIVEYHLRGLSQDVVKDSLPAIVELYNSDGKSATDYMQNCKVDNTMIDGKWNIECVIPNTIKLPFTYAVNVTRNTGTAPNSVTMTSMFSVGNIPVDVKHELQVSPSQPQAPATPPTNPITDKNPQLNQNNSGQSDGNKLPALSYTAAPMQSGCSLIR